MIDCLHYLVFYLPHLGLCLFSAANLVCRTLLETRDIYRSLHSAEEFCTSHAELQNCISLCLDCFNFHSVDATYGQIYKWSSLVNL